MSARLWMVPKELRSRYMFTVKGLDLIEQCHENISEVCADNNFWKDKLYYDYKVPRDSDLYNHYSYDEGYNPYELYVLLAYVDKYEPDVMKTFETDEDHDIDVLTEAIGIDGSLPTIAFKNFDIDVIDVYINKPNIVVGLLSQQFTSKTLKKNIKSFQYIWNAYPQYQEILSLILFVIVDYYMDIPEISELQGIDDRKLTDLTLHDLYNVYVAKRNKFVDGVLQELLEKLLEQ